MHAQAEARAGDRNRAAAARKVAEEHDRAAHSELETLLGRSDPRDTEALLQALIVPADVAAQLDDATTARADLVAAGGRARERVKQERDALDALAQDVDLPDRDALAPLTAAVQALTADGSPLSLLRASRAQEMAARDRSRQALSQARTDRDITWSTIARSWVDAAAPPDQERRDVAAEYARHVLHVDCGVTG